MDEEKKNNRKLIKHTIFPCQSMLFNSKALLLPEAAASVNAEPAAGVDNEEENLRKSWRLRVIPD